MCMWYMLYVQLCVHAHMALHVWVCGALETYLSLFPDGWLSHVCCLTTFFEDSKDLAQSSCLCGKWFSNWATFPVSLFSSEQGCVATWALEVSKPSYNYEGTEIILKPMTEVQARERCSLMIYTAYWSPEKVSPPTSLLFSSFFSRWDLATWPKLASNQWSSCLQSKVLWLEVSLLFPSNRKLHLCLLIKETAQISNHAAVPFDIPQKHLVTLLIPQWH